jgi:crotonobetainyl-CoA:carnitine CoA-transferase CaiB-like acyl-CoA transferase
MVVTLIPTATGHDQSSGSEHAWQQLNVPCAKINTIADVVANEQLHHREQIVEIEHPTIGELPMHGLTIKFGDTGGKITRSASSIGQHTDDPSRLG